MTTMNTRKRNNEKDKSDVYYERVESGDNIYTDGIKGDEKNIAILFFLYLLQGLPLGLMQAVPIILTNTGVSYRQQAEFSLVNWPFSLKLLWAPIVDSLYWRKIGRRKSWLVPTQYLIGLVMLLISCQIDNWIGEEPKMEILVVSFFFLNFLAATQDIAVDGWALTMLKRHNVGYASTCNSVGQTAGYFLGYVVFIALESASFCNDYLRTDPLPHGIVTLPEFLWFWGWVFLLSTTLVWILKSESAPVNKARENKEQLSIKESYKLLIRITKLAPIKTLLIILLTAKVAFSACDSVAFLKMIETGVPKEKLALLAIPLMPLQIILPLYISRYTAGPAPIRLYLTAYPYRLVTAAVIAGFVYLTPYFLIGPDKVVPVYYYVLLVVIYGFYQVAVYTMFVSQMAFFAKVSDPSVGGTYMTLLNTLANMGGNWPQTLALWAVDSLTLKQCSVSSSAAGSCSNSMDVQACEAAGGSCSTVVDGFYMEMLLCTVIGMLWLLWGRGAITRLQNFSSDSFSVSLRSRSR